METQNQVNKKGVKQHTMVGEKFCYGGGGGEVP